MENPIKELIELSTSSGAIKQEYLDFIYQKAEEKGISKIECDIYIENALNVIKKQDGVVKTEKSYRGWWFILVGIGDFIWGISCMDNSYTQDLGIFGLLSGILFILVGAFLLGRNNVKSKYQKQEPSILKNNDVGKLNHENKVIELIKDNKVKDAIFYYSSNHGFTWDISKSKVKEIAERNGLTNNFINYDTNNAIKTFAIIAVVIFVLSKLMQVI
jgi:hypothetical protein